MLPDVIAVRPLTGHRLRLRFDDGFEGDVDIARLVELSGVFEPLRDLAYFARVAVVPDLGTIAWPNGADIDPLVLYHAAKGEPLPDVDGTAKRAS